MHRTFISTIVAAALTITGISSTMAQAGEYRYAPQPQQRSNSVDPVAATIAGFVALAIIGKAIDNNGGFKKKSQSPKQHVAPQPQQKQQRAHSGHRSNTGHRAHRGHRSNRHGGWHRHGNGHRHNHAHGPRHHRGRH